MDNTNFSNKLVDHDYEDQRDPLEYAGGEFDADEPSEIIQAARVSKTKVSVHIVRYSNWRTLTAWIYQLNRSTVTVKVIEPPQVKLESTNGRRGRVKKEKYTVSSLPFPQGSANVQFTQRWRKVFKSSLIFWASCQDDPFGTNALLDTVIERIWNRVFPSLASAYNESKAAICQVVSSITVVVSLSLSTTIIDTFLLARLATFSSIGEVPWERKGSL